jgi:GxxExxY protein
LINDGIILELKAAECIVEDFEYQLINYLKATIIEVGLLLNFGKNLSLKEKYLKIIEKNY